MSTCYACGQPGHKKPNCPNVECHRCHQKGHLSRDCSLPGGQQQMNPSRPRTSAGDSSRPMQKSTRPHPSSNAHKIPPHWRLYRYPLRDAANILGYSGGLLSKEYTSLSSAITDLWKQEMKFKLFVASESEQREIKELVRKTWREDVVVVGTDARNITHTNVEVVKVERVENPELYERYSERKQKLIRRLRDPALGDSAFSRVESLPGSTGPVLTTQHLRGCLRENVYFKINEHYLFHGTKEENALIIARDGMDNRFGSGHSLLGAGLYMAESCTKADQYTDHKISRSDNLHKMFLVRAMLGQPYINKAIKPPKFQRPPCRSCQQILCHCPNTAHHDSIIDDAGRLFRGFVVYDQSQCYPEYVITYKRVTGAVSSCQPYGLGLSVGGISASPAAIPQPTTPQSTLQRPSSRATNASAGPGPDRFTGVFQGPLVRSDARSTLQTSPACGVVRQEPRDDANKMYAFLLHRQPAHRSTHLSGSSSDESRPATFSASAHLTQVDKTLGVAAANYAEATPRTVRQETAGKLNKALTKNTVGTPLDLPGSLLQMYQLNL